MRLLSIALLFMAACSPATIAGGVYAEPPDDNCMFIEIARSFEDKACWCVLEGRTEDGADALIMLKVPEINCKDGKG